MAQLGSALRSGRRGRGFKSRHPDCTKGPSSAGMMAPPAEGQDLGGARPPGPSDGSRHPIRNPT